MIAAAANTESTETAETASVPMTAPTSVAEAPTSVPANAAISSAVPTPNVIPSSGTLGYTTVTIAAPKKEKRPRERKYTLGHLILCLATAGVMAVAAGIFAGLYFSVV